MNYKIILCSLSIVLVVLTNGCNKDDKMDLPEVATESASNISINSALLSGYVYNEGGLAVTGRGFCYSAIPGAGLNDSVVTSGFGPGDFSEKISGLRRDRTYYYRAYATNGKGTAFGEEKSFKTESEADPGPTLSLKTGSGYTSNDATIQINEAITVGVNGTKSPVSGHKLTRFKFTITSNNVSTTMVDSTFSSDSFSWASDISFTGVVNARLFFEIWDAGGMKSEKFFYITTESPGPEVNKFLNVEFGSWNDAVGGFFSSTEGIIYNVSQTFNSPANQLKIDFIFFKGVTNANTFASPDDADVNTINDLKVNTWPVANKNQTRFNATNITAAQFDAIGSNYRFPNFNIAIMTTKMNNLVEGQVLLFKTKNNKLGLVKVVDLYSRGDRAKASIIVQK